jgi:CBS domain-containing protein
MGCLRKKKASAKRKAFLAALIVGYIDAQLELHSTPRRLTMKVSDILRVKGGTLFTVQSDEPLSRAMNDMAEKDLGSLVVMAKGALAGMLTFREVIQQIVKNGGQVGNTLVREAMEAQPLVCSGATDIDEVRRMMLEHHARYMPVMDDQMLMGVISFYDVAKAVVDSQNFENTMLKAYIRDWPDASSSDAGNAKQ